MLTKYGAPGATNTESAKTENDQGAQPETFSRNHSAPAPARRILPALDHAGRRWPVLPIWPRGKEPIPTLAPNGFYSATTDAATIRAWWKDEPRANVAIRTGAAAGVVVVDEDAGGDETIRDLERALGPLPDTPIVLTAHGRHRYYAYPDDGAIVPCSVGALGPGVDIRADGGYAIAAGSVHPTGHVYAWELDASPDDLPLAPLPPAWLARIRAAGSGTEREPVNMADVLGGVPEGARDDTLFRAVCKLRHADVPYVWARRLALEAAAACTPPFPETIAIKKVDSAYSRYRPGEGAEPLPSTTDLEAAQLRAENDRLRAEIARLQAQQPRTVTPPDERVAQLAEQLADKQEEAAILWELLTLRHRDAAQQAAAGAWRLIHADAGQAHDPDWVRRYRAEYGDEAGVNTKAASKGMAILRDEAGVIEERPDPDDHRDRPRFEQRPTADYLTGLRRLRDACRRRSAAYAGRRGRPKADQKNSIPPCSRDETHPIDAVCRVDGQTVAFDLQTTKPPPVERTSPTSAQPPDQRNSIPSIQRVATPDPGGNSIPPPGSRESWHTTFRFVPPSRPTGPPPKPPQELVDALAEIDAALAGGDG